MNAENTRSKARKDKGPEAPEPVAQANAAESQKRETLSALVGKQVLHALGQPENLLKVQVRPLWQDNYRVNVFVGPDAACARIPHSYFVVADADGKVLATTPKLVRKY